VTGDIIALSPPLIIEPTHIQELVATIDTSLRQVASGQLKRVGLAVQVQR
jgi:adenosylmethionine-8-amino-7-oxononanoate aminotransferase